MFRKVNTANPRARHGCRRCGKPVISRNGMLECCGSKETVAHVESVERVNREIIREALTGALNPVSPQGVSDEDDFQ